MNKDNHEEVIAQLKKINHLDQFLVDLASSPREFLTHGDQTSKEPESYYNGVTSTLLKLRQITS